MECGLHPCYSDAASRKVEVHSLNDEMTAGGVNIPNAAPVDLYGSFAKLIREEQEKLRTSLMEEVRNAFAKQQAELMGRLPPRGAQQQKAANPSRAASPRQVAKANKDASEAKNDYLMHGHRTSTKFITREDIEKEESDATEPYKLKCDGTFSSIFAKDDSDVETPHWTTEHFYKDTGLFQAIARSDVFINFTLVVISCNAVYLGVDADRNTADILYDSYWPFILFENLFCFYFTAELIIRYLAFKRTIDACKDGWFRFDFVLVGIMIAETWVIAPLLYFIVGNAIQIPAEPLRLLRLLRLTRMARLMRALPEIVTMTKGMIIASRAVTSALLMIAALTYLHAIVLHMLLSDNEEFNDKLHEDLRRQFDTIPMCMWTLLLDGTFMMDGAAVIMTEMLHEGTFISVLACLIFLLFVLLSALTVMNMLIGVLCRVVTAVAEGEVDDAALRLVKETILLDLKKFDDGKGMLTHEGLVEVMSDPQSKAVLRSLNVDRLFLMELQRMLFPTKESSVSIKTLMELMLMCRGDLPCTVKSLSSGLSYVSTVLHQFEFRMTENMEVLRDMFVDYLEATGAFVVPNPGADELSTACCETDGGLVDLPAVTNAGGNGPRAAIQTPGPSSRLSPRTPENETCQV